MQSILAVRDPMVALGVLAAAALAGTARADNCMGNGCKAVVLDFEHCEARVTSDTPVRLQLSLDYTSTGGESGWEQIVSAKFPVELQIAKGCLRRQQILSYNAFLMPPPDKASLDATQLLLNGPQSPRCQGAACDSLAFDVRNHCVWASNKSDKPVALTIQSGSQSLDLSLEAADAAKSGPQSNTASSPKSTVDWRCASAHQSQKMLQEMAAEGTQIPATPELDAILAICAREEQADAQAEAPKDAYYGWAYEPLSQSKYPVYSAKIVTPTGCFAGVSDIASYSAAYR